MSLTYDLRAQVAGLSRHRSPDDPGLIATRSKLQEQVLIDAIERALAKAPPLTPAVRERIIGLLSSGQQRVA